MSETWVDVPTVQIAAPDTWHTMSLNHLIETKNQILDKIHMAKGNQVYIKPLNSALQRLDALIAQKLNDPLG